MSIFNVNFYSVSTKTHPPKYNGVTALGYTFSITRPKLK